MPRRSARGSLGPGCWPRGKAVVLPGPPGSLLMDRSPPSSPDRSSWPQAQGHPDGLSWACVRGPCQSCLCQPGEQAAQPAMAQEASAWLMGHLSREARLPWAGGRGAPGSLSCLLLPSPCCAPPPTQPFPRTHRQALFRGPGRTTERLLWLVSGDAIGSLGRVGRGCGGQPGAGRRVGRMD